MESVSRTCGCSLVLAATLVSGVAADEDYHIGAMVAAAGVSFIMLAVVIAMLVVGFTWNSWYPAMQATKGRVKMPREYWLKREEAKRRLIEGSATRLTSVSIPPQSDPGLPNADSSSRAQDTGAKPASWVQGWTNGALVEDNKGYEEMQGISVYYAENSEEEGLAMDLGEEVEGEDDFRIETDVVDNETLDLGPFRDQTPEAVAPTDQQLVIEGLQLPDLDGAAHDDAYPYATVDRSRPGSRAAPTAASPAPPPAPPLPPQEEAVTSFSKTDPELVAF